MKKIAFILLFVTTLFAYNYSVADVAKVAPKSDTKITKQADNKTYHKITLDEATIKSKEYIIGNFKGYTIKSIAEKIDKKGRKNFVINTLDAGGNKFTFKLNYKGQFKGPIKQK